MKLHTFRQSFPVRTALCVAVVFALTLGYSQAGEPNSKKPLSASAKKKLEKEKKIMVTGSNIPQQADRLGRITTHSPVVVIDHRTIERTGRVTLIGVLSSQTHFR